MSDDKTTSNDNDLLSNPREHDHLGHYDQPTDCPKTSVLDDNHGQFEQITNWLRSIIDELEDVVVALPGADGQFEQYASQTTDEKRITTVDFDDIAPEPPFATLHFYADDPESMARLNRYLKADEVLWALQEFDQWLRGHTKHTDADKMPDAVDIRETLHQCFEDRGLNVWEE